MYIIEYIHCLKNSNQKKFGASNFSTPHSSSTVARSVLPAKFILPEKGINFKTDQQIGKVESATVYAGILGIVSVAVMVYNFDKLSHIHYMLTNFCCKRKQSLLHYIILIL